MRRVGTYYDRLSPQKRERYKSRSARAAYKWRQADPIHYRWLVHKSNAARMNRTPLSEDAYTAIAKQPCNYCGDTPAIGIDRRDNGKDYTPANVVPACAFCNHAKQRYSEAEFRAWLSRIRGLSL